MQRVLTLVVIAAALVAAAVLFLRRDQPVWTTSQPEALAAFREGLEAEMKYYHGEALDDYRRAAELDPAFAMAKLKQLEFTPYSEKDEQRRLTEELRAIDTSSLTERERFLVTLRLAREDKQHARAQKLLSAYVAAHPKDPFALSIYCAQQWESHDWTEAENCYRRLLKLDPNWVMAQNHLGYTAMAQGRFDEAEELFRTYLFIAPDQANPHDSLGELYTLRGRYDEAEKELNEAIRIRPDFCPAWRHLLDGDLERRDFDRARARLAEIDDLGSCEPRVVTVQTCRLQLREPLARGDFATAWAAVGTPVCGGRPDEVFTLLYRATVGSGHFDAARAMEDEFAAEIAQTAKEEPTMVALGSHIDGLRLLATGDPRAAAEELRRADANLVYWGEGLATFKLYNRLDLTAALRAAGRNEEAEAVLAEVRQVNPALAAREYKAAPVGVGVAVSQPPAAPSSAPRAPGAPGR